MPIYEYRCGTCGETSEFLVFGNEEGLKCKKCDGQDLKKLMSAPNISNSGGPSFHEHSGGCCGTPNSCGNPGSCCGG